MKRQPDMCRRHSGQSGYALAPLIIFMAICTAILVGWMKLSVSSTRTVNANKLRVSGYMQAESALNTALSWIRANSVQMMPLFSAANFCNTFALGSTSTYGDNDPANGTFPVPSQIKIKNTNNTPLLVRCISSCSGLGSTAFPSTSSFNPTSVFAGLNVGSNIVKIALVDAIPNNAGAPNAACATGGTGTATDFIPVYRIDAMTGNDAGSRVFGYVTGSLSYNQAVGFYGDTGVDVEKPCASDHFTGSSPDHISSTFNAKCSVGSRGDITFKTNPKSKIYGSATTTGGSVDASRVCPTNPASGTCSGQTCTGASCALPDPYSGLCPSNPNPLGGPYNNNPFTTTCSANQGGVCSGVGRGDITSGSVATAGCYRKFSLGNNTVTLTASGNDPAYYVQQFDLGTGKGTLAISPTNATGVVEMHVARFAATETAGCSYKINGNQSINVKNNKTPSQFRMIYWGICDIEFLGNSNASLVLYAPNSNVIIGGNADYYGAAFAKHLNFKDQGGSVVYDESLGGSQLTDVTYKLRNVEETYR